MSNPLVAPVTPSVSPEDGIAIYDFAHDSAAAFKSGDWIEGSLNAGAAALDALAFVADPFQAIAVSAFSWAMEHIDPLPKMLDSLAGSPDVIQANAATWANVAEHLNGAADEMANAVKADTAGWYGPAIDAYRPVGLGEAELIRGAAAAATAVGAAVTAAGAAIAAFRTLVRDTIAEWMYKLVKWLATRLAALALSLGAATPLLVADAIRMVAECSTKVAKILEQVVSSIKNLASMIKKLKPVLDKVKDAMEPLKKISKAAGDVPLASLTTGQQAVRNAAISATGLDDKDYAKTVGGDEG
ncbi:WXG100 family type VII secretion target [Saccharopolyspora hordei]|uniref:PPE domain-containing protein n=1 Tax=Saccharopolyspora hordei TaxID=1838 RepID=A0A853AG92_9PSEU|nr:hypothetical protein [Saccharopolyspora hordei]NYI82826.1 hypothetical protein [Saccharopolyspora hordei]